MSRYTGFDLLYLNCLVHYPSPPSTAEFRGLGLGFRLPQRELYLMGVLLLAFAVQLHFLMVLSRTGCTINTYRSRETHKPSGMPGWPGLVCMPTLILGPSLGEPTRPFLVPFSYGDPREGQPNQIKL